MTLRESVFAIDNSTYKINNDQLNFFKEQVATGLLCFIDPHSNVCTLGKAFHQDAEVHLGVQKLIKILN